MKIGVIGVGEMGGTLARRWASKGHSARREFARLRNAEMTRRGVQAAIKGRAEKSRASQWRENYGRLFTNHPAYADVHADVIAMNRSFNPL